MLILYSVSVCAQSHMYVYLYILYMHVSFLH